MSFGWTEVRTTEDTLLRSTEDTMLRSTEDTVAQYRGHCCAGQRTLLHSTEDTLLRSTEDTLLRINEETVAQYRGHCCAVQRTLLRSTEDTLLRSTENTLLRSTEDTLLRSTEDTVAQYRGHSVAQYRGHSVAQCLWLRRQQRTSYSLRQKNLQWSQKKRELNRQRCSDISHTSIIPAATLSRQFLVTVLSTLVGNVTACREGHRRYSLQNWQHCYEGLHSSNRNPH